ncbi:ATP-binding protein [Hymenobacter sp. BT664]|uniref:ATP-binding protein n=1 Tax=Hymenobacter montanus TaxID=2771359 RepID=A0A927GLG7_9BACT|nr:ATP-binding protein [Hymenobacter montanus]MBD2770169.1 ATP-binding protein [Hymenobacter montanus]
MLKRLHLKNFTVFADADFEFVQGLNVIVGTNGTGKSHVLKLGYVAARVTARILGDEILAPGPRNWEVYLSQRLKDVLQPEELGKLVRWGTEKNPASITAEFKGSSIENLVFNFLSTAKNPTPGGKQPVSVKKYPKQTDLSRAIFIPPKEVLTLAWLRAIYEKRLLPIDDTYPSLLDLLNEIPLRELNPVASKALKSLERILGGRIELEGERFYLISNSGRLEMNMVAEGIRKFAMLERLLRNGVLTPENVLFWDEPEANLNPKLLREMATVLAELARQGFQIILATHSMGLLKEFHILSRQKDAKLLPIKYFGLNAQPGYSTTVVTAHNFEYLPDVVALEVELEQADDLEEIFVREDQERHAENR